MADTRPGLGVGGNEMARRRRHLRPLHVPRPDPLHCCNPVDSLRFRDRPLRHRPSVRPRLVGGRNPAAASLGRRARSRRYPRLPGWRCAARGARGSRVPLPRGVRPMAERDVNPLLDRDRGSLRRGWRHPARRRGLPGPALPQDLGAAARRHADDPRLRLSLAHPLSLRLRPHLRARRHHHLRHAADGAGDHAGTRRR